MFTSGKKKTLCQVLRGGNSSNRFVGELSKNEGKLFNKSFDSAQSSLNRKPNLKQTQICVRRSLKRPCGPINSSLTTADNFETKTELFLMPMPKIKTIGQENNRNITICGGEDSEKALVSSKSEPKREPVNNKLSPLSSSPSSEDPLHQAERNMKVLVGNVGFVMKMFNSYANLNALWDVYGKIVKISEGKHRYEHILLVRNIDDSSPILQCRYFDFNNTLDSITIGSNIRLVGNLTALNYFRTFKIEALNRPVIQSNFMRIRNVNSFVLLQYITSNNE